MPVRPHPDPAGALGDAVTSAVTAPLSREPAAVPDLVVCPVGAGPAVRAALGSLPRREGLLPDRPRIGVSPAGPGRGA